MVLTATAVLAAGCASPGPSPSRPRARQPPAPAAGYPVAGVCGPPQAAGRLVTVHAAGRVRLAALTAGTGPRGVLLIPELGRSGKCGWWDFAAYLAANGYRVLAFDHRCTGESSCPSGPAASSLVPDIRAAAGWLRRAGAAGVVLMGASQGASEALIAATRPPAGVSAVVSLSADELTTPLAGRPYPATAAAAAPRVGLPVLFAVAAADPYVGVAATRRLYAAARPGSRLIILGSGAGHGWDLVRPGQPGAPRPALAAKILAFLRAAWQRRAGKNELLFGYNLTVARAAFAGMVNRSSMLRAASVQRLRACRAGDCPLLGGNGHVQNQVARRNGRNRHARPAGRGVRGKHH